MNLTLDYTTRCRVPGCTKTFVSSALDVPICAWKPEEEQQGPIEAIPVEQDGEETPERL